MPGLTVTLSVGLAHASGETTGRQLFDRADQKLYTAKNLGRNRLAA